MEGRSELLGSASKCMVKHRWRRTSKAILSPGLKVQDLTAGFGWESSPLPPNSVQASTLPVYLLPIRSSQIKISPIETRHMGQSKALWSDAEEAALRAGVEKYGLGKWRLVKKDIQLGPILISRSNVQLKDKWRNMTMRSMDANWVESPRKRPRDSDISTIIDISTKKEKTVVADEAEFSRMMPFEEIRLADGHAVDQEAQAVKADAAQAAEEIRLPEGHAVEEAQGMVACQAKAAEIDAEASWSRQMTATEAGSAVIKAVEATLAGLAVYKTAANEQKAAFAEVEATKEEHVIAAAIEKAQGAEAATAIAKARVEKELRKACALAEYWCKCRNN